MQKLNLRMQKLNLRIQKLNFPGTHWRGMALIDAQKNPCLHDNLKKDCGYPAGQNFSSRFRDLYENLAEVCSTAIFKKKEWPMVMAAQP